MILILTARCSPPKTHQGTLRDKISDSSPRVYMPHRGPPSEDAGRERRKDHWPGTLPLSGPEGGASRGFQRPLLTGSVEAQELELGREKGAAGSLQWAVV